MGEGVSNPIIELDSWEYERGFSVGIARFTANWGVGDAKHYDRSKMEEDRNAQAAAALCEIAVAKYTNRYWHGHAWPRSKHGEYRHMPDVGRRTEVRRLRTANGVAIRRSDSGKVVWGARTADDEYRRIELLGFVEANEFISIISKDSDWGYIPLGQLRRPWVPAVESVVS